MWFDVDPTPCWQVLANCIYFTLLPHLDTIVATGHGTGCCSVLCHAALLVSCLAGVVLIVKLCVAEQYHSTTATSNVPIFNCVDAMQRCCAYFPLLLAIFIVISSVFYSVLCVLQCAVCSTVCCVFYSVLCIGMGGD